MAFRLLVPSFLAGAVITLTFLVVLSMLIRLFFSMNRLLGVLDSVPQCPLEMHELYQTENDSNLVLDPQKSGDLVVSQRKVAVKF